MKKTLPDFGLSNEMPAPEPARGGRLKAAFWAFLAVLLVACLAGWLYVGPDKREKMRETLADAINDAASGTPVAGIGDIFRDTPPPLPPQILSPPTDAGTLSGRKITGTIASPVDFGGPGPSSPASGRQLNPAMLLSGENTADSKPNPDTPVFSPEPVPPATEDSLVRPGYLADLANWLASRYRPGAKGGTLALSVQNLNQIGGVTIAGKTRGGRSALLRYAFQPSMLDGLYKLYIDRFMDDLDAAAAKHGFDAQENRNFHLAIAGRATVMASALEGIMKVPDLGSELDNMENIARNSVEINAQLANTVSELDEARQRKAAQSQISTLQMRVDGLTARYRRAMGDHAAAKRTLVARIRDESGQTMDEDSLLFMASWVERRIAEGGSAREALNSCVRIMRDLARRCALAQTE